MRKKAAHYPLAALLTGLGLVFIISIIPRSTTQLPTQEPGRVATEAAMVTYELSVSPDPPTFTLTQIEAKPGEILRIIFRNTSHIKEVHNFVLLRPGTIESVSKAATRVGPESGYVPDLPEVLAHTRLLKPGESQTIVFRAPEIAGDYPYICTYPGHFRTMKGELRVRP